MFRSMSKGKALAIAVLFGFLGWAVWQMTGQAGMMMSQICGGVGILYFLVFLVKVRRDAKLARRPARQVTNATPTEQPKAKNRFYIPD